MEVFIEEIVKRTKKKYGASCIFHELVLSSIIIDKTLAFYRVKTEFNDPTIYQIQLQIFDKVSADFASRGLARLCAPSTMIVTGPGPPHAPCHARMSRARLCIAMPRLARNSVGALSDALSLMPRISR